MFVHIIIIKYDTIYLIIGKLRLILNVNNPCSNSYAISVIGYKQQKINLEKLNKNNDGIVGLLIQLAGCLKAKPKAIVAIALIILFNLVGIVDDIGESFFDKKYNNDASQEYEDLVNDQKSETTLNNEESNQSSKAIYIKVIEVPFEDTSYKEENFEEKLYVIMGQIGISGELRIKSIKLKTDENKKVNYFYVNYIVLNDDVWKSYIVKGSNNDGGSLNEFTVESDGTEEKNSKSVVEKTMDFREGFGIFQNYVKLVKDYEGSVNLSLSTRRYKYMNTIYAGVTDNKKYNFYLADIDKGTTEEMPLDYGKDEKGRFIMMKEYYKVNDEDCEDRYIVDLDK